MIVISLTAIVAFIVGGAIAWIFRDSKIRDLKAKAESFSRLLEAEKEHCRLTIDQINARHREERDADRRVREDSDRQWQLRLDAIKKELIQTAAQQMNDSGDRLRQSNTASIDALLKPLREQMDAFRKAVEDSSTQSLVSKKEIQEKFDATLRLFQQQQQHAVSLLTAETSKIGTDAVNLAKALQTNSKRQGNWGEMVLQTMLENSGLEENVHFFLQYNVKDDMGHRNIPDVVIKFPEGKSVIIDSKVSLTAYTRSFETDDDDRRRELLKDHLASVEKHVDELSIKNYPRLVAGSMDYVMMFIPNESSYIAAMKLNPSLLHDAYQRKVIIVSPNNLMMALQIAFNLWQSDKQIKSVEKIVQRGKQLYDKVVSFQQSFSAIGEMIGKLQATFDRADSQLSTGPGNVLRQCEMLEQLGVTPDPKKRIKSQES